MLFSTNFYSATMNLHQIFDAGNLHNFQTSFSNAFSSSNFAVIGH